MVCGEGFTLHYIPLCARAHVYQMVASIDSQLPSHVPGLKKTNAVGWLVAFAHYIRN